MKNTEFRIGNKLQKHDGNIFTIKKIDETDDVLVVEENGLLTLNYNLIGINITNEWLLKFGFEKSSDNEHWFIGHHGFCLVFDGDDWCLKGRLDEPYVILYIRTVHKMQNVYFDLTGEELNVNN